MEYDTLRLQVTPSTALPGTWDIAVMDTQNPVLNNLGGWQDQSRPIAVTRNMLQRLRSPYGHPDPQLVRQTGTAVRQTLLGGPNVQAAFGAMLANSRAQGRGVRLVVMLTGTDGAPGTVSPGELPLEALHDDNLNFLAISETTPLVRSFRFRQEASSYVLTPPLRVLIVTAAPNDLPPADIEAERDAILNALQQQIDNGVVEVRLCEQASPEKLFAAIRDESRPYDILHFICHGGTNSGGESYLCLTGDDGSHVTLSAEGLDALLKNRPVRLMVFSACSSAVPPLANGQQAPSPPDPYPCLAFSGIAQRLITAHETVGAVVAMQFDFEPKAAVAFSAQFYTSLVVRNWILEKAVTEARIAVTAAMTGNISHRAWITPVLYSRAKDGRLFDCSQLTSKVAMTPQQELELKHALNTSEVFESNLGQMAKVLPKAMRDQMPLYQSSFDEIGKHKAVAAAILREACWPDVAAGMPGGIVSVPIKLLLSAQTNIGLIRMAVQYPTAVLALQSLEITIPPVVGAVNAIAAKVSQAFVLREGGAEVFLDLSARSSNWSAGEHGIAHLNFAIPQGSAPGRYTIALGSCSMDILTGWKTIPTLGSSLFIEQA